MKALSSKFLAVLGLLFILPGSDAFSQQPVKSPPAFDLQKEGVLGKIRLGQNEKEILSLLGKPSSKGPNTLWEATGDWVQEWKFSAQDLVLNMASSKENGTKAVLIIKAGSGCKFATARGIKIGSSLAEVRLAYRGLEEKAEGGGNESFVAGSIYGGVIFSFENGKVATIFIGAAAE